MIRTAMDELRWLLAKAAHDGIIADCTKPDGTCYAVGDMGCKYDGPGMEVEFSLLAIAGACLSAIKDAGYVVVPREPSRDMETAVWDLLDRNAKVGNLRAGHIRGNGMPGALWFKMIEASEKASTIP